MLSCPAPCCFSAACGTATCAADGTMFMQYEMLISEHQLTCGTGLTTLEAAAGVDITAQVGISQTKYSRSDENLWEVTRIPSSRTSVATDGKDEL